MKPDIHLRVEASSDTKIKAEDFEAIREAHTTSRANAIHGTAASEPEGSLAAIIHWKDGRDPFQMRRQYSPAFPQKKTGDKLRP